MAEREIKAPQPGPAELLRAALEKIVFFEWRVAELASELAAAHARCASAEQERSAAEEQVQAALDSARAARLQLASIEAERGRLAALLMQPARALPDRSAIEAEQHRAARLEAELEEARRQLGRQSEERQRWLDEMVAQTRDRGGEPAALAQFISELRGEIISLRARLEKSDAILRAAGLTPPASDPPAAPAALPKEPEPVRDARALLAQGRLSIPLEIPEGALANGTDMGTAGQALAEQCLRSLHSDSPSRRAQAARHLTQAPFRAAAPAIAAALGQERDPKARAQLCRALAACGGETAADLLAQLQSSSEPPLVRLAALDALATIPGHLRPALEVASRDGAAAVRRRAAALAAGGEHTDVAARFAADEDASVRGCAEAARREAPIAVATQIPTDSPRRTALIEAETAAARPAEALPARSSAPAPPAAGAALLAVQAALFGLTEAELADHIGVPEAEATAIARDLVAQGRLGRRGKRLVMAAGGAQ